MKKILCCLLATVCITSFVKAQTDKGDWMVGGSLSLNTTEGATSFIFNPNIGHFFGKNFAAGAELTIATAKLGDVKTTTLGIGPFARYYFELKEPVFKPYVHGAFSVASVRNKLFGDSETETATGFILGLGGAYFINNNVAIDGLAGYNYTKVENSDGNGGFLFRIGFQVHLLGSEVGNRK